jgi:hypothetical protein
MMSAEQQGENMDDVCKELVEKELLPHRYLFHDRRIEKARKVAAVSAQLELGLNGWKLVDELP